MIMLQHFYDDFLDKVPRQLPQLLDTTRMEEPKFYDDFVLLTFVTDEPYDLEEVMDMFVCHKTLFLSVTHSQNF